MLENFQALLVMGLRLNSCLASVLYYIHKRKQLLVICNLWPGHLLAATVSLACQYPHYADGCLLPLSVVQGKGCAQRLV